MKHYKIELNSINRLINTVLNNEIENKYLLEIMNHALSGGKRLRAIIPVIIGKKINKKIDLTNLACFIELFHNASLIIDDLPCMDNDLFRRNKKTVHNKYGVTKAQLTVNIMMEIGNKLLSKNFDKIEKLQIIDEETINFIKIMCYQNINDNLGLLGAASGQFIDTCPINKFLSSDEYELDYNSMESLLNLIHLKTSTLFEISFVCSYLMSGGDSKNIDELKKAVRYFGLAFQISDDFEDIKQDMNRNNEDQKFNPNLVCKYGKHKILKIYNKSVEEFKNIMKKLNIYDIVFEEIMDFLQKRIDDNQHIIDY